MNRPKLDSFFDLHRLGSPIQIPVEASIAGPTRMSNIVFIVCVSTTIWLLGLGISTSARGQNIQINEIMASNAVTISDEESDFPDWIELYNPGPTAIDLTGWGLSDKSEEPFKWTFSEFSLAPYRYLLPGKTAPGT